MMMMQLCFPSIIAARFGSAKLFRAMRSTLHQSYYCSSLTAKRKEKTLKKYLIVLGLSPHIDQHKISTIRSAYLQLAKEHHPDAKSKAADPKKFYEVQVAYENVMIYMNNKEKQKSEEVDDDESTRIERTAPQHRQYLSYDGVGFGTPSQRRRQYDKYRTDKAADNVYEFRKNAYLRSTGDNSLVKTEKENRYTRRIKTRNLIDRVVEDLIQESMSNGEFDNLEGKGKPLKSSVDCNPFVDSHTHRLNTVLINNGYAPEWMTLEAEIRSTYQKYKASLTETCEKYGTNHKLWYQEINTFRENIQDLNRKVDKFNMIVPSISIQLAHYSVDLAIQKVIQFVCKQDQERL